MTKERIVCISLILAALPLFLPGQYVDDGISRYEYGFPFPYTLIYTLEPNSVWLASNLFSDGINFSADPLIYLINVLIFYLSIRIIVSIIKKIIDTKKQLKRRKV